MMNGLFITDKTKEIFLPEKSEQVGLYSMLLKWLFRPVWWAKGKKFKYRQFRELLLANHNKPMEEQKQILDETIGNWKGDLEQVDDVCIIGVRV